MKNFISKLPRYPPCEVLGDEFYQLFSFAGFFCSKTSFFCEVRESQILIKFISLFEWYAFVYFLEKKQKEKDLLKSFVQNLMFLCCIEVLNICSVTLFQESAPLHSLEQPENN